MNRSLFRILLILPIALGLPCAILNAQDTLPRIEIGAILSTAKQTPLNIGNDFHAGGGGRVTVNVMRFLAGEVELTRQPTGNSFYGSETHTALAVKGTYRAEQRRWLKFAGLNFFGVVGPAFVNRTITVADPNPPPFCFRCTVFRRQTAKMLDIGGGFEIVPTRAIAIRFDVTHGSFTELPAFASFNEDETRTYLKAAFMLRLP